MFAVTAWFLVCLLLTLFYTGLMTFYKRRWERLPDEPAPQRDPATRVSIIIPARNEAAKIGALLEDIRRQDYPPALLEVIVMDDHSDDDTYGLAVRAGVTAYRLQDLLHQHSATGVFKKRAIEHAVQRASGTLIVTTDADCRVPSGWIRHIAAAYEATGSKLIAAPVQLEGDSTWFEHFQVLDFCGMQAITAASLHSGIYNMANGANLAYERAAFDAVGGYAGIDRQASGDDMLLVYKIAQHFPGAVRFLRSRGVIVRTTVMHGLGEFLQQRFRWTSKSGSYQDKRMTLFLALVYLFVLSLFLNLAYALNTGSPAVWALFLIQFAAKGLADWFFLRSAAAFFGRGDLLRTFLSSEILHSWYIVFVGTLGNILPYTWKGRKLR